MPGSYDLDQAAGGGSLGLRGYGLRSAPEVHVRRVVHAGHRAPRRAGLLREELAANVLHRIARQRLGRITALLRAVVHQAVFANVKISRAGAASPPIFFFVGDVVLEEIELAVA